MSPSPLPPRPRPAAPRARARTALSHGPGPVICMQRRARPRPPYLSGLSSSASALSRRRTLVPGPRSVLEPSGRPRAFRGRKVKWRHFREGGSFFHLGGPAWKSLESAPLFFRLRLPASAPCAKHSPPIGARAGVAAPSHAQGLKCACALRGLFTCPEPAHRTLLAAAAQVQSPELRRRKSW